MIKIMGRPIEFLIGGRQSKFTNREKFKSSPTVLKTLKTQPTLKTPNFIKNIDLKNVKYIDATDLKKSIEKAEELKKHSVYY